MNVKKIVWIEKHKGVIEAGGLIYYGIYKSENKISKPFTVYGAVSGRKSFTTLEEAKEYCQKEYDDFILSQII